MVRARAVGSLAARAFFYMSSRLDSRADQATYTSNSVSATQTLQTWYNTATGLWDTAGWWNSGNVLTVLADFASLNPDEANKLRLGSVFANTFENAQKNVPSAQKAYNAAGMVVSSYSRLSARELEERGFDDFINEFYDDEGWWALGLIRAFDVTGDQGYLQMAERIYDDMAGGWDNTCGGGIWWSKEKKYKNAIANELYLSVAASLANRAGDKAKYLNAAQAEWAWFKNSGMINGDNRINDGLTINADGSCTNNGQNEWSYNQGVILGGLVELNRANGDSSLIPIAKNIAAAAIQKLAPDGILHDTCEPDCGGDGAQFKGIFLRNLHYLQKASPEEAFKAFILTNADKIWQSDRDGAGKLGVVWSGPPEVGGGPTAASHSSAMDALVAAMAVA